MKINSELSVSQVLLLIKSVDLFAESLTKDYIRGSKKAKRIMFFRPWLRSQVSREMLVACNFALQAIKDAQELREMLLESTGLDIDMRPITLREMLANSNSARGAK
jgi:predicted lipoprotein